MRLRIHGFLEEGCCCAWLQEGKWGVNVGNKDRTDIVKVKTLLRAAGLPPNALDAAMSDRVRRHPSALPPTLAAIEPRVMVRSCGIASHPGTVLRWAAGAQRTLALACGWF